MMYVVFTKQAKGCLKVSLDFKNKNDIFDLSFYKSLGNINESFEERTNYLLSHHNFVSCKNDLEGRKYIINEQKNALNDLEEIKRRFGLGEYITAFYSNKPNEICGFLALTMI